MAELEQTVEACFKQPSTPTKRHTHGQRGNSDSETRFKHSTSLPLLFDTPVPEIVPMYHAGIDNVDNSESVLPATPVELMESSPPFERPPKPLLPEPPASLRQLQPEANEAAGACQAEVRQLRLELCQEETRLRDAKTEAAEAKEEARRGRERHQKNLASLEYNIAQLRQENSRLEGNARQAGVLERRLAGRLGGSDKQDRPNAVSSLLEDCCRLQEENRRLEQEIEEHRAEISRARAAVTAARGGSRGRPGR